MQTSERAAAWLRSVADLVIEKGKAYGDSLGKPVNVFSNLSVADGIRVRLDDKIARVARGGVYPGDDNLKDLAGYLALLATVEQEPAGVK
jgi:hypothetical protein